MEMTREAELREDAELGRKAKIAAEVWQKFLDVGRERLVQAIETQDMTDEQLRSTAIELKVLRAYRNNTELFIQQGEIAEKELSKNGE
ncbi:MAG: hypothetical protein II877_02270 [Synergistaceae bacterium]|nr:hypothetical protein [Synergistaceae bacterium]